MNSYVANDKKVMFILYIGLPGSGKTHTAMSTYNTITNKWKWDTLLLDDLSLNLQEGVARFNEKDYDTVLITDPRMCGVSEGEITKFIKKNFCNNCSIFFNYFENDPEACIINARRDPKPGGTESFIKAYTKKYIIPEGATVLPVYKES